MWGKNKPEWGSLKPRGRGEPPFPRKPDEGHKDGSSAPEWRMV